MTDQDRIIDKVQKLLNLAADNPFSEEADAARARADALMTQYTIESWQVEQAKPKDLREQVTDQQFDVCDVKFPGKQGLQFLLSAIADHCRCKSLHYNYDGRSRTYRVKLFGFPTDLRYAEMLWVSLQMQMSKDMNPHLDPSLSEEENLVRFKEVGMKWQEVHAHLHPDIPWERKHGVRYTGIYTNYCREHNKQRMYTSPTVFVRSYIEGFCDKINERFYMLARLRRQQERESGPGTELVLVDRAQEVQDAFDNAHKSGKSLKLKELKTDASAYRSGAAAGERADIGLDRLAGQKAID